MTLSPEGSAAEFPPWQLFLPWGHVLTPGQGRTSSLARRALPSSLWSWPLLPATACRGRGACRPPCPLTVAGSLPG